ncbi:general substrate transporter [Violaceomyces palustris]|uniref:General substrate transporter n=1 Tax=Violaceomyces palustris TaxID=1673888 RepID=A0ACD0NNL3_9BASI|nr:general substrate transporter [Violaceomyces palustris]
MFGQVLAMPSFTAASGVKGIQNPTLSGLLTSILELGAWLGVLFNGVLADWLGRRLCVVIAVVFFCVGVIVQACTRDESYDYILAGRFVTGIGVGSLSMIVPLYNAEVSPPEIRGSLVALQQMAIVTGIMVSYWFTFGTNHIGGTGSSQNQAAWLLPITIQILPALILAIGIMFMPQSPRWLMDQGREEECLETLAGLRRLPKDHALVEMEFLELKAQKRFETQISVMDHPELQDGSARSRIWLVLKGYKSLVATRPNLRRTTVAVLIMVFQQWTGVNFIVSGDPVTVPPHSMYVLPLPSLNQERRMTNLDLRCVGKLYYAPFIFRSLGLSGSTTSLLASGVVGVVMWAATIPAVLYIDRWGRKKTLIAGAVIMAACHFFVAGIIGGFRDRWETHKAAGWIAVVFVWIFAMGFGFSWGPCAWCLLAEIFSLGSRARGISIGASSNWLNNFAVAISTPDFVTAAPFGAYIFLGGMCVLSVLFVWFMVPETSARSLDEIDELFGDKLGRSLLEAKMLIEARRDVGLFRLADIDERIVEEHSRGLEGLREKARGATRDSREVEQQ